jgi:hypothetical protein
VVFGKPLKNSKLISNRPSAVCNKSESQYEVDDSSYCDIDTSVMPFLIIKVKERVCILDQQKIVIPLTKIILLCADGIVAK